MFLLPPFCGNPLLKHRRSWQGLLYFSKSWGLWYLQIASKMTWFYDYVVFEPFPVSRTPIYSSTAALKLNILSKIFGGGNNWAVRIPLKLAWYLSWCPDTRAKLRLWELALLSRCNVIVHSEHDDPEHSKAPLGAASADHRLVFLATLSEILFFSSIWNRRFPNSQPLSLQICPHTLYIFVPQHFVSCVVSLKTWPLSWEFHLTAEIKLTR